jgi:hypothetical protein
MKRQLAVCLFAIAIVLSVVGSAVADPSFGPWSSVSDGNQQCKPPRKVNDLSQSRICVNPCALAIFDAFVTRPSGDLNPRCIASKPTSQTPITAKVTNAGGTVSMTARLPAGFAPGHGPGVYASGPLTIKFQVFPAGTSAAEALKRVVDPASIPLSNKKIRDGGRIDGYRAKVVRAEQAGVFVDAYVFRNTNGTFAILSLVDRSRGGRVREVVLPDILKSVVVRRK